MIGAGFRSSEAPNHNRYCHVVMLSNGSIDRSSDGSFNGKVSDCPDTVERVVPSNPDHSCFIQYDDRDYSVLGVQCNLNLNAPWWKKLMSEFGLDL